MWECCQPIQSFFFKVYWCFKVYSLPWLSYALVMPQKTVDMTQEESVLGKDNLNTGLVECSLPFCLEKVRVRGSLLWSAWSAQPEQRLTVSA